MFVVSWEGHIAQKLGINLTISTVLHCLIGTREILFMLSK